MTFFCKRENPIVKKKRAREILRCDAMWCVKRDKSQQQKGNQKHDKLIIIWPLLISFHHCPFRLVTFTLTHQFNHCFEVKLILTSICSRTNLEHIMLHGSTNHRTFFALIRRLSLLILLVNNNNNYKFFWLLQYLNQCPIGLVKAFLHS